MELLSLSLPGSTLLLSGSEDGLFLYPVQSHRPGRPLLLCSGYKNGLAGCCCDGNTYYTYINKENALLLRRLFDPSVLLKIDSTDYVSCLAPQLISFHNTLLLFYFEYEAEQKLYRLKLYLPFSSLQPNLPDTLASACSVLPGLHVHTTAQYLYLILTTEATSVAYRYSASVSFEPLFSEEEVVSVLRLPWESEKKQLEQTILQSVQLTGQQQALLTEKEQKLHTMEARLAELSSEAEQTNTSLRETAQTLAHTSLLLERAKTQYAELMQVAEQYRQEAMKWYEKFTDRH